jgi:vacuole morphology and inheritance protein 14
VELLNLILLTSAELADFRDSLRGCFARRPMTEGSSSSLQVFRVLYSTWAVNPIATISLCLLGKAYELSARLVTRIAEMQITVGLLMQVDKLVQLLESPVFMDLRMALLAPSFGHNRHLFTTLYGLLMILPQGTAYATLKDRLQAATSLHIATGTHDHTAASAALTSSLSSELFDIDAAEEIFAECQQRAREAMSHELRSRSVLHSEPGSEPPREQDDPDPEDENK